MGQEIAVLQLKTPYFQPLRVGAALDVGLQRAGILLMAMLVLPADMAELSVITGKVNQSCLGH